MSVCEVLCCRSSLDPNRIYHKFPSDTARKKEWLKILGKKSTDIKPKSVVCSRHFRFKDYYSGGKRLLPSAIPALKLSNSPKKEKPVGLPYKVRKSEPNRQINVNRQDPTRLRKSVPNIKPNQFKEVKPKLLKNISKSNIALETSRSKQLVKTAPTAKNEKENVLKSNSDKGVGIKHLKDNKINKISWKPVPKMCKRSPLRVRKTTLSQSRLRSLCKNKQPPLETKDERKHTASSKNKKDGSESKIVKLSTNLNSQSTESKIVKCPTNLNSQSSESKIVKCPTNLISQRSESKIVKCQTNLNSQSTKKVAKLEENKYVERSKNSISSGKIIIPKSSSDISVNERKTRPLKQLIKDKTSLEVKKIELRNRRSIRKRKRLLSEDCSANDDGLKVQKIMLNQPKVQKIMLNQPKVQLYKKCSGVSNEQLEQSQPSMCNTGSENLSGIEKTILEMQNKIQMLEKKAILDEMKIETFKKALITQRNTDLKILMDEKENELLLRMDLLYLDYDPQRICRLCLQLMDRKEDLIPLFLPLKNQALLSLIKQATNVEVEQEDGMPSSICGECLEDIKRVDWLKRRTQKSNTLIRKFVAMKKSSTQNNAETSQVASGMKPKPDDILFEDEITDEFKIEDVFSLENSPMLLFENITVKQEPESDEENKLNHKLNTTYSIAAKKPLKPRRCRNCSRSFKNPWASMVHSQYCFKRFQCSECNRCFLNAALFRKHKQQMYACYCAEYLRYCSDCNISFRWKWQLVFHVLRHGTQDCVLCDDTIHSEEHLQNHLKEAHPDHSNFLLKHLSPSF